MDWRRLLTWWAGLLAVASGLVTCAAFAPCMGSPGPAPAPLKLISGKLAGAGQIVRAKHTIEVKAYTDKPATSCWIHLEFWDNPVYHLGNAIPELTGVVLNDEGVNGDLTAHDGEWTGQWTVPGQPEPPYAVYPVLLADCGESSRNFGYQTQEVFLPMVIVEPEDYVQSPGENPAAEVVKKVEEGR